MMVAQRTLTRQTTAEALQTLHCSGSFREKIAEIAAQIFPGCEVVDVSPRKEGELCKFRVSCDGRTRKVTCSVDNNGSARHVMVKDV